MGRLLGRFDVPMRGEREAQLGELHRLEFGQVDIGVAELRRRSDTIPLQKRKKGRRGQPRRAIVRQLQRTS